MTPTLTVGGWALKTAGKPSADTPATAPAPFTNDRRPIGGFWSIGISSLALAEPEQLARDDEPLDLVSAFVDLHDLRVPHEALDRKLPRVPDASEDLDCVGRDLHRRICGEALRHRGLEHGARDATVAQARDVMDHEPRPVAL